MTETADLQRRLERFRAARPTRAPSDAEPPAAPAGGLARAQRLARAVDGEVVPTASGTLVRLVGPPRPLRVDRVRLAALPGQPPPHVPLVCLDTETTGLGTAAGTMAFLVGLGWWDGDVFRQVQLLVADHSDEPALLDALAALVPPAAWLVTYNGRGFDWPLLVTRYRLARREPPPLGGHLDLLPLVRRVYRHRLDDARLRTVETGVLGVDRHEDVPGWEIPGRYLEFLRAGDPRPLIEIVRHNDEDVRTLGRLLAGLERTFGDGPVRARAHPGDLAGMARAYGRERRFAEALSCLETALARGPADDLITDQQPGGPSPGTGQSGRRAIDLDEAWWSPHVRPDFGGRPGPSGPGIATPRLTARWTEERLLVERAHLLRRLGRIEDAVEAWTALAAGSSRLAAVAAIQLAKLQEHQLRDRAAALAAAALAWRILERRRMLGLPEPALESDLARRSARLRRRSRRPAA